MGTDWIGTLLGMTFLLGMAAAAFCMFWIVFCAVTGRNRRESEEEFEEDSNQLLCDRCGYDLRGGLELCPECGEEVAAIRARRPRTELDPHKLRDLWPHVQVAVRQPAPEEHSVNVFRTTNQMEANLLVEQLLTRGVNAGTEIEEESRFTGRSYETVYHRHIIVSSGDWQSAQRLSICFVGRRASLPSRKLE